MEFLQVDDAQIEYEVRGQGEPVLFIHLAIFADGLARPLLAAPELASRYRLIHYHRRGYVRSTAGAEQPTVALQAADAAALLKHLGVKAAHIVGHSIGGLIALQLTVDAPDLVHSLALLEPGLPMVPGAQDRLGALFRPMLDAYGAGDKRRAIEMLSDAILGPDWRVAVEQTVPGGIEQAMRDADATIRELPPMQAWQFSPHQASTIHQPVLSVVGLRTSPFMKAGRVLLHSWLPQTEDSDPNTTHLLQMKDPEGVAHALADFFGRHPISAGTQEDARQSVTGASSDRAK